MVKQGVLDYSRLFKELPSRFVVLAADSPDYLILEANVQYAEIAWRKPADIIGKPLFEVFPPSTKKISSDGKDVILKSLRRVIKTGKPDTIDSLRYDVRNAKANYVIRYWKIRHSPVLNNRQKLLHIVQSVEDITKQVRVLRRMQGNEQQVRFMAETLPVKIFTADADGRLEYINQQWKDYTGLSIDGMRSPNASSIIHPDDLAESKAAWEYAMRTGLPFEFEQRIRRYDGKYRWHLSLARALYNKDGTTVQWIGSNTDIDDLRRMIHQKMQLETITKALKNQRSQLVELNAAKDEFISLASHQLRTPATAVKQYVGMLIEGYVGDLTQNQISMLQTAYESNEQQLNTVNDLLHVAQIDAGKVLLRREDTDMDKLISGVIKGHQRKFDSNKQTVIFEGCPDNSCYIDKARIRMVIENLVDNACKYSPPGKTITVGCRYTSNAVIVTVQDEGVGIDPKQLPKLFKKFSRIDNPLSTQVGGTGLGLYWAKKIVSLHRGKLEVTSEVNVGTTFSLRLPLM